MGHSIEIKRTGLPCERKHDDKRQYHARYELSGSEGKRMMRKEGPQLEMLKAQLLLRNAPLSLQSKMLMMFPRGHQDRCLRDWSGPSVEAKGQRLDNRF